MFFRLVWLLQLSFLFILAPCYSQTETPVVQEYVETWDTVFSETEQYLQAGVYSDEKSESLYNSLSDIRSTALGLKESVDAQTGAVSKLLEALGEKPEADSTPESVIIAQKRDEYEDQITHYKEQLAQIELAFIRTDELTNGLSKLRTGLLVQEIFSRYPPPLNTDTLFIAIREALSHIQSMVRAPLDWYNSLERDSLQRAELLPTVLIIVFSVSLGFFMRAAILNRYGRDDANENPSLTLRISAAIAEGVARGLVPLLTLAGLGLWIVQHNLRIEGLFLDMLRSGFKASVYFVVFSTLTMAVLSPNKPDWRLTGMSQVASRIVGYTAILLIGATAIDFFIVDSTRSLDLSLQMQSVYLSLVVTLKSSLILIICSNRWWDSGGDEETTDSSVSLSSTLLLLLYVRRLIILIAVISIIATGFGYANFATYLIDNLISSTIFILGFMGLRAILMESLAAITRSGFLRKQLGLRIITLQRIRLWVGGLITTSIIIAAIFQLLLIWGVAKADLLRGVEAIADGFSVGSITISLTEIVFAVLVFIAAMALTRLFQRSLLNTILPQFTSDRSVQHSLSSGAGYIGILIAFMMFIAALGIKLESIVIVAGALSVGIGFGLQNIVNNFVSGLILILERPIKVGDWVVVGENEGFVQEINFRATELETFTRASVIIPNSEILSNAVTNLTYHDKIARIEIPLQVAYGTGPRRVFEILQNAAHTHELVLANPEPFVLLTDFGADGLCFELRCYVRDGTEKLAISSAIRLEILEKLEQAGIDIPYPQRVVRFDKTETLDRAEPFISPG